MDRNDPEKLGRVRVRIPGLLEPASAWAWPIGAPGGGGGKGAGQGFWWIPKVGAEVAVWFKGGDPDHPRYMPSNWGAPGGTSEVPAAADGGNPDVIVLAFGPYDVIVDTREESKGFKIRDRSAPDDNIIEFDGVQRAVQIKAMTALKLEAVGQVEINGLVVTVNGVAAGTGAL